MTGLGKIPNELHIESSKYEEEAKKALREIISKELSDQRAEREWSMEQMAGFCNVSPRQYGKLESGQSLPSLITAVHIYKQLDVSLDSLKEACLKW